MDNTVGEDNSGVNSRSEMEATGVEGDDISLSPEEFAGEYERKREREDGGGREDEREGGGEGGGGGEGVGESEREGEGVGEGERESGGDDRDAEEVDPEVDAADENVENWDATEPEFDSIPRMMRTGTCL